MDKLHKCILDPYDTHHIITALKDEIKQLTETLNTNIELKKGGATNLRNWTPDLTKDTIKEYNRTLQTVKSITPCYSLK